MKNTQKLDQLTSLRFFAALMIVVHHAEGLFGVQQHVLNLGQDVSFFFVLSGFILTYVYPQLNTKAEMRSFFLARFARIWPVYVVTFLFAFVTLPFVWSFETGIPFLAMLQSWLPLSALYFSYNAVAWSISTEVFFYLAFPFLIQNWSETWGKKVLLVLVILVVLAVVTSSLKLPDYGNPYNGNDGWMATVHGMIYINPVARLLEFVTGMVLAYLWTGKSKPGPGWTFAEIMALLICVAAMYYTQRFAEVIRQPFGDAAAMWMLHSGSFLGFGLLIFVMAHGAGYLSRLVSLKVFVILGEISFAMYLLHQTLFSIWRTYSWQQGLSGMVLYSLSLLGLSLAAWMLVEKPGRRLILLARPLLVSRG